MEVARADARDAAALARRLRGAGVVVNCAPYRLNLAVMEAALRAGCHYIDLGGLFHMTRRQLALDRRFRRAGLLAVLGMGSAPGIVERAGARAAADPLRRVRSVRVYNGGADFTRYRSPLAFPFSPATLLDELTQAPMVFEARPLQGGAAAVAARETFRFDLGVQTVHYSLHSEVATLPAVVPRTRACASARSRSPTTRCCSTACACWWTSAWPTRGRGRAGRRPARRAARAVPPPAAAARLRGRPRRAVRGGGRRGRARARDRAAGT